MAAIVSAFKSPPRTSLSRFIDMCRHRAPSPTQSSVAIPAVSAGDRYQERSFPLLLWWRSGRTGRGWRRKHRLSVPVYAHRCDHRAVDVRRAVRGLSNR
eukprot:2186192-Prymnesium_polylepis.1